MREKLRDKERLQHIIEAIENIQEFTQNVGFQDFENNKMLKFAVIKNFEIIGEAAFRLTNELREINTEIEWHKIITFRHILVHDYYQIDSEIVWKAIVNKLPQLLITVKQLHQSMI